MTSLRMTQLLLLLMPGVCFNAMAYEEEESVPLTIFAQANDGDISQISIKLNGRDVEIKSAMRNEENAIKRIGFAAYTPFFEQLGDGEEHIDKTFSDLTVTLNATRVKPIAYRRGFFLGQDVSGKLSKGGVAPLPDTNLNEEKLTQIANLHGLPLNRWQGYVAYSWIASLQANSINWQTVRYRALPQFERDDISSDRFNQRVLQHCGNPEEVRTFLEEASGSSSELLVERYELPVQLVKMQELRFEITQPTKNWLGVHPFISLMCGISERYGSRLNYSGRIASPDKVISVLVISKLAQLLEK